MIDQTSVVRFMTQIFFCIVPMYHDEINIKFFLFFIFFL